MWFFPSIIKPIKHTLISIVSPNWGTNIYKFKYNTSTKKWHRISHRFFYHDQGLEEAVERMKK